MGMATPGTEAEAGSRDGVELGEDARLGGSVGECWSAEWDALKRAPTLGAPRSQRPSIRPMTAVGVPSGPTASTGEPLWPLMTLWLRRKTSVAGAALSS